MPNRTLSRLTRTTVTTIESPSLIRSFSLRDKDEHVDNLRVDDDGVHMYNATPCMSMPGGREFISNALVNRPEDAESGSWSAAAGIRRC